MWQPAEPAVSPTVRHGARRALLTAGLGLLATGAAHAQGPAPAPVGLVVPRAPAPDWPLLESDGRRTGLSARLHGHITAVQLMFAGCSTSCPVQGAVFADVAARLQAPGMQLMSLTIDPLGDDPVALAGWLRRFGEFGRWTAAAPRVQDVEPLAAFLRGLSARAGTHSAQVFLFDRQARLAYRTADSPPPAQVTSLMEQLASAATRA